MTDKSRQRFDVYFAGECLKGHDLAAVRAALGKLFKASEATLDRLFSGAQQPIKRGCDKATALNYQRAMTKAGAKPIITRVSDTAAPSDSSPADTGADAHAAAGETELTLAPPGSDMLRPEERQAPASARAVSPDFGTAPVGERLGPPAPAVEPVPAPDFALAPAGENMGVAPAVHAAAPDTGDLSLAPGAFDLSDCAPDDAPEPELDLDHLVLEEAGADILTEEQRDRGTARAPDVSHLAIEPRAED